MDAAAELRALLLEKIRGTDNGVALNAIRALRAVDGSVILRAESLIRADLREANLASADLREAVLIWASLYGANLTHANMQGAVLFRANLRDANLIGANLQRAYLLKADFRNADLHQANFDEGTTLPDGRCWTPSIDVTCYSDPRHPRFWAVDDPALPPRGSLPSWLRNDLVQ
jgi:hypothetical protein